MSGVWLVHNSVVRLVDNPGSDLVRDKPSRTVLVHQPAGEIIKSYDHLEKILSSLGWQRYYEDPDLLQFHKRSTVDLLSLPKDFSKFKSVHMYDIVVKNRHAFEVHKA